MMEPSERVVTYRSEQRCHMFGGLGWLAQGIGEPERIEAQHYSVEKPDIEVAVRARFAARVLALELAKPAKILPQVHFAQDTSRAALDRSVFEAPELPVVPMVSAFYWRTAKTCSFAPQKRWKSPSKLS